MYASMHATGRWTVQTPQRLDECQSYTPLMLWWQCGVNACVLMKSSGLASAGRVTGVTRLRSTCRTADRMHRNGRIYKQYGRKEV